MVDQPYQLAALEIVGRAREQDLARQRTMMQMAGDLRHLIIDQRLLDALLDAGREPVGSAGGTMPQRRKSNGRHDARCMWDHPAMPLAIGDAAGDDPRDHAESERGPEVAPQGVHAFSRAISRQPMSRRWKPSAKSIWSTARYARARALAKLSATAVTASTRPPLATSEPSVSAVPAWKTVTPSICSAASMARIGPPPTG